MPQSSKYFLPFFNVIKCLEPVTVLAAPWKAIFMIDTLRDFVFFVNENIDQVPSFRYRLFHFEGPGENEFSYFLIFRIGSHRFHLNGMPLSTGNSIFYRIV